MAADLSVSAAVTATATENHPHSLGPNPTLPSFAAGCVVDKCSFAS